MNLLIGILLSIVIISGVGLVYSQTEPISAWIKDVAGFWAEDMITDTEFVEALEFLYIDLKQKIKSMEFENILELEPVNPIQDTDKFAYMKTDKLEYGLGDTIHVTGLKFPTSPTKLVNRFLNMYISPVNAYDPTSICNLDRVIICTTDVPISGCRIDWLVCSTDGDNKITNLTNDKDRTYSFDFTLTADLKLFPDVYRITVAETIHDKDFWYNSNDFTIK